MMSQQDLTADMLTRIRNAIRNRSDDVRCLNNRLNRGVAKVLLEEGYINHFEIMDNGRDGVLRVDLKYGPRGEEVIRSIDRVSKPGCRVYKKVDELPRPLQGLGIAVVSTSKGVLSDRRCREEKVGGELVAIVS
ncbi:MAG: 30S ribosomal protein S8 [Phycisphaerales bacterium]|jgi:small subunit ribosomal protein S8|nr:30S ribosomal protein S8 [Phycisphaerales bacterium]|tara:strand:+ start:24874 stop:25275 length:402 start_codon:yes stop_codon:yes gene_type:complete